MFSRYPLCGSRVSSKLQKEAQVHTPSYLQMGVRSAVAQLVERYTGNNRVASLGLTGVTVLCPWERQFIRCLEMVEPKKTGNRLDMTKIVDWCVKHQQKQNKWA